MTKQFGLFRKSQFMDSYSAPRVHICNPYDLENSTIISSMCLVYQDSYEVVCPSPCSP